MTTPGTMTPESVATVRTGRFVWYDLVTTDVEAAIAFYSKIAGWKTEEFEMRPKEQYRIWTLNGEQIGDVVKLGPEHGPPGTRPYWMSHVEVSDVDATAREVTNLGGTVITQPIDIPAVGRYAVITDPQGAVLALYTPNTPHARNVAPKIGEVSWHELATTDHRAAMKFYRTIFGWETVQEVDTGPPVGTYVTFGPPGATPGHGPNPPFGGMFTKPAGSADPTTWFYYVRVGSVDDVAAQVTSLGGKVINGPMDVPGGDRIVQCTDPQGAMIAFHSYAQA